MSGKTNLAEIFVDESASGPMHGDGDGGSNPLTSIAIEVVLNGYILTLLYEDETTEQYVFTDMNDVFKMIRSRH